MVFSSASDKRFLIYSQEFISKSDFGSLFHNCCVLIRGYAFSERKTTYIYKNGKIYRWKHRTQIRRCILNLKTQKADDKIYMSAK